MNEIDYEILKKDKDYQKNASDGFVWTAEVIVNDDLDEIVLSGEALEVGEDSSESWKLG